MGLGIICMLRPICKGEECIVKKAPEEKDFDKYVYRLGETCYEFTSQVMKCPASGAIEAFSSRAPASRATVIASRHA